MGGDVRSAAELPNHLTNSLQKRLAKQEEKVRTGESAVEGVELNKKEAIKIKDSTLQERLQQQRAKAEGLDTSPEVAPSPLLAPESEEKVAVPAPAKSWLRRLGAALCCS